MGNRSSEYRQEKSCVDTATSRGLTKVAAEELRKFPKKNLSDIDRHQALKGLYPY
jgi:hypothetical protein